MDTLSDLGRPDLTAEVAALRSLSRSQFPSELVLKSGGQPLPLSDVPELPYHEE